jgi:RNA polymerase sigma factor (sigma-70 family)
MTSQEFERLVEEHATLMSSAIRRVCGQRGIHLVPDVEQEVRLALWKHLKGGKKIEHPVSYLYKVAITTAASVLRKQRGMENRVDLESAEARTRQAPPGRLNAGERRLMLEQVLGGLPEEQGRALRAYLAGFNHREIARFYGWSESTARHRLYRGLDALRKRGEETRDG